MNRSPAPPFAIEIGALISPRLCGPPLTNQRQIHQVNGMDVAENFADPFLAFVEGIAAVGESLRIHRPGFSAVITGQEVRIIKRQPVDAPTLTHGLVTALDEGPRGVTFATQIVIADEDGEPFAEMTTSMRTNRRALRASSSIPNRGSIARLYLDLRARAEPMFCYIQGLESLACLIARDGRLEKIGVQAFAG